MSGAGCASKLVDLSVPQNQGQGQLKDGKENTLCLWSETGGVGNITWSRRSRDSREPESPRAGD